MKQLSGMDTAFLAMETTNTFGHVNSLSIYERPDDKSFDPYNAWRAQIESRLNDLEPFRRRLVEVPLGLDRPYWIIDPDFDLDFHLRRTALPSPGGAEALEDLIARLVARPMDRSRPLWESYVIEGLDDPKEFGVFTKIHHAAIDGAAGAELTSLLLDRDPDTRPPTDVPDKFVPEVVPTSGELLSLTARELLTRPRKVFRLQRRLGREIVDLTKSQALRALNDFAAQLSADSNVHKIMGSLPSSGEDLITSLPTSTAPPTPFNHVISGHRRFKHAPIPLADIKQLKSALGVTLNDVVMALCAGGLRNYLLAHDALPDEPLVAMVPVSIRTGTEDDKWTNRVAAVFPTVPTNIADPLERTTETVKAMNLAKGQFEAMPADLIMELADMAPPALSTRAIRLAARLRLADRVGMPINVVISNVPGPREELYMSGAKLTHYYPISTIADGEGLNITVQSYLDTLDIGLVSCRELVSDLDVLMNFILAEVDVLYAVAGVKRPTPAGTARRAPAKKSTTKKSTAKKAAKKATAKKATAKKATAKKAAAKKATAKKSTAKKRPATKRAATSASGANS